MNKVRELNQVTNPERLGRIDLAAAFRLALEVARETCRAILADAPRYAGAHFEALKRILDREAPDYKS